MDNFLEKDKIDNFFRFFLDATERAGIQVKIDNFFRFLIFFRCYSMGWHQS